MGRTHLEAKISKPIQGKVGQTLGLYRLSRSSVTINDDGHCGHSGTRLAERLHCRHHGAACCRRVLNGHNGAPSHVRSLNLSLQTVRLRFLTHHECIESEPSRGGGVQDRGRDRVRAKGQAPDGVNIGRTESGLFKRIEHEVPDERCRCMVKRHAPQVDVIIGLFAGRESDTAAHHRQVADEVTELFAGRRQRHGDQPSESPASFGLQSCCRVAATTEGPAMVSAHLAVTADASIGTIDRYLFGSFVEHLGRSVYTGIYEPGHPTADADGFRHDVLDLVAELGVSIIRYPGGNFVSGYRWEDGVGPRELRPRRLDLAWHTIETNEVGLHEFMTWLDRTGAEPMLAVNFGTRGLEEALDFVEYCVIDSGTALADARVANGRRAPIRPNVWCLGNEMDGPWQLGHLSAEDYAKKAASVAHAIRLIDPDTTLVACGSSSRDMPTFGHWERTVLEATYEYVDLLSCHAYYWERDGDLASFLASGVDMEGFIDEVVAVADEVKEATGSDKTINLSFDEWNVWYLKRHMEKEAITGIDNWPVAPRLLEDIYSVADGVVVGGLLIALLKHADRVKTACMAQLVNVIGPIMTEPGGPAWRQTTFFPFAITARLARGEAVAVTVDAPIASTGRYGDVPLVDAVATKNGNAAALFLLNRSTDTPTEVDIDVSALEASAVVAALTLADDDPYACNTLDEPERVGIADNTSVHLADGRLRITLPACSWTAIELVR